MEDKLKTLHSNLVKEGYDLPDIETFRADMADPVKSNKLHSSLVSEGYELPDYDTFLNDMGLKKKDLSEATGEDSETSSQEQSQYQLDLPEFNLNSMGSDLTPSTPESVSLQELQRQPNPKEFSTPDTGLTLPEGGFKEVTPETLGSDYLQGKDIPRAEPPRLTTPVGDMLRSFKAGGAQALGSLAATPKMINDTLFELTAKPILRLMGATDEEIAYVNNYAINTVSGGAVTLTSEAQAPLNKKAEETRAKMAALDGNIWSNLTKGADGEKDLGVALELFGRGAMETVPFLIEVAATSGGSLWGTLAVIAATTAAQQYAENEGMDKNRRLNAWMYGGFEGLGELATGVIFRGIGKAFRSGLAKNLSPTHAKSIAKGIASAVGLESSSEAVTQIGQNFTDIVTGKNPQLSIFDNVPDAAILGGGLGLLGGGLKPMAAVVGRALASNKEVAEVQENVIQQKVLIDQLDATDNESVKEALDNSIKDLRTQADAIMDENYAIAQRLTEEERNQVAKLYSVAEELQSEIDNGNITNERKPAIEKTIKGLKDQIQTIKDKKIAELEEQKEAEKQAKLDAIKEKEKADLDKIKEEESKKLEKAKDVKEGETVNKKKIDKIKEDADSKTEEIKEEAKDQVEQIEQEYEDKPVTEVGPVQKIEIKAVKFYDALKKNNAPRIQVQDELGRERVVFDPIGRNDYMDTSDETGRKIRWGVELSDGRVVSLDGLLRITKPDVWAKWSAKLKGMKVASKNEFIIKNTLNRQDAERLIDETIDALEREDVMSAVNRGRDSDGNRITEMTPNIYKIEKILSESGSPLAGLFNREIKLADGNLISPIGYWLWKKDQGERSFAEPRVQPVQKTEGFTSREQESILNKETDLLGDEKEEAMIPVTYEANPTFHVNDDVYLKSDHNNNARGQRNTYSVRGKNENGDYILWGKGNGANLVVKPEEIESGVGVKRIPKTGFVDAIDYAQGEGLYQQWIKEGRMTADDAIKIMESANVFVPQEVRDLAKQKQEPQFMTINEYEEKYLDDYKEALNKKTPEERKELESILRERARKHWEEFQNVTYRMSGTAKQDVYFIKAVRSGTISAQKAKAIYDSAGWDLPKEISDVLKPEFTKREHGELNLKSIAKDTHTKGIFIGKDGKYYKSTQSLIRESTGNGIITREGRRTDEYELLKENQDLKHLPRVGSIRQSSEGEVFEIERLNPIEKGALTYSEYKTLESTLHELNNRGIQYGDNATAMRRDNGVVVLIDLSNAQRLKNVDKEDLGYKVDELLSLDDQSRLSAERLSLSKKNLLRATKTQPSGTFRYILTQRPPSIGTHPEGVIKDPRGIKYNDRRAWELEYDRPLTQREIDNFELARIPDKTEIGDLYVRPFGRSNIYLVVKNVTDNDVTVVEYIDGEGREETYGLKKFAKEISDDFRKIKAGGTENARGKEAEDTRLDEERISEQEPKVEQEQTADVKYATDEKPDLKFLEEVLPPKKPNKKDKISIDDVSGEFRIKPISQNIKRKAEDDALKNAVATDPLRPIMEGIYYDVENQVKTASDSRILVVIPAKVTGRSRVINPKTKQVIEGKYPDYKSVVPKNIFTARVSASDILDKASGVDRANAFVESWGDEISITAKINYDDKSIEFNPAMLKRAITALLESGTTDIRFEFPPSPSTALVIRDMNNPKKFALVMPVMAGNRTSTILNTKTNIDPDIIRESLKKLQEESWAEKHHAKELSEAKDKYSIEYHTKGLKEARNERLSQISELEARLADVVGGKTVETPTPTKSTETKAEITPPPVADIPPIQGAITPEPTQTTTQEKGATSEPISETRPQEGIKYRDKTYQSVDQIQDDYDLFPDFKTYNEVLDKVRKFEDGLREEAGKKSANLGKKIKVIADDAELKIKNNIPDKNTLSIKFFPIDISRANTAIWKHTSKVRDKASDWIARKMQEGATSQIDILRWVAKVTTNLYGGLIRTQADIMAKLKMSGTVKEFAPLEAKETNEKLLKIVNSDPESLRRVRDVLDPDVATEGLTYDDLTPQEQTLHDSLVEINTWIHETNYANGFIPTETYLKFKNPDGSVKYIARMYDEFEIMPPEIGEFTKQGKSSSYKLHSDIYKQRKEIDDWKKEHAITDPVYLTTKRLLQTIQNGAVGEYINTVKQEHPNLIKDYKRGDVIPRGFTKLSSSYRWGDLRGKLVADHIVEDFTGFFYASEALNSIYDALKLFDRNKLNQFYKKWHTVYNPFVQLGNFTGNLFFSSIAGINPVVLMAEMPSAIKDANAGTAEYKLLLKSGILGSTGITGDMTPITTQNKPIISGVTQAQSKLSSAAKSVSDIFTKVDEATTKLYQGTDNIAKYAAYKVFRKQGLSHEQSVRRVYDSFQNYSTVGKTWDLASKTPVFGNKFIKFQADLQRILINNITMNPMTTMGTLMLVSLLGQLASRWSGEDEDEKILRESRKGVAKIPFVNIPLSFKVGKKEVNVARYFSPLYLYRYGDSDADLAELSKFFPIQLQKVEKPQLGESGYTVSFGDPLLGWIAQVAFDRDFRGNSIQNPQASKYFNPNPTTEERIANVMNYVGRTQIPFYRSAQDMYDGMTGQLDYYGRKRTWSDAILNNLVKIQEFDSPELKDYIEGNISYLTNRFAALSERMGNANSSFLREIRRAEDQKLSESAMATIIKEQDAIRSKRLQKSLTEQTEVMKELERLVTTYQKWNPDDPFLQEHYRDMEAGKNKRFNVLNEVDLQRKYKDEYLLLKNNGLMYPLEIPNYHNGVKLSEEQRKQYAETYWSNYIRLLDEYIGLTQEEIDEHKKNVVDSQKADTQTGEKDITSLKQRASDASKKARESAGASLNSVKK